MILKKISILSAILLIFIAGCSTEDMSSQMNTKVGNQEGTFRLLVSDAPTDISDFKYLHVHISKARIFSGEGSENSFEEREINVTVDITKLVGEISTEVLSSQLVSGNYTKVELFVDSTDGVANNQTAKVMVPSEKLQITKPFEIIPNETTSFVFDINVVKKGQDNEYNLLPVISESGVVGKDLDKSQIKEVEKDSVIFKKNEQG